MPSQRKSIMQNKMTSINLFLIIMRMRRMKNVNIELIICIYGPFNKNWLFPEHKEKRRKS